MRIGIDARLYHQTGVGRYIRNLIEELSQIDIKNDYFVYLLRKEFNEFSPPNIRWHKRLADIPWHTVKEQYVMPRILLADRLDAAHFTYFNVPVLYPKKYILTIHDLIVDHFDTGRASTLPTVLYKAKRLGYRFSIARGIKRAETIVAISKTTKQEIIDHYRVPPKRIHVTYDALDRSFANTLRNYHPEKYYTFQYVLYVGNAYPHKNLERTLLAFKKIKRNKPDYKLVLAGDDKYFYPRLKDIAQKHGIGNDVVFFGEANDKQLINLYTFSSCLVFPSLMEGFGLPTLEALSCGKIPVISDIPVFREIWDKDLPFFDPYNFEAIADRILGVLDMNSKLYRGIVTKASRRLSKYSWKKTAFQTLELYENVFNGKV